MSPLDRKLLRDLMRIKGQATAIGVVVAVGVMLLVMQSGLLNSLEETRRAYYERYRLADVFAPVTRAPLDVLDDIAAIPGVSSVEGRITGGALIDVEGQILPVRAQAVSLPEFRAPKLNDLFLSNGRTLTPGRSNEVIVLKSFADAQGLKPGDTLSATMNGARRSFQIVGFAQSPEFLYTTPPGELVPDEARFAVIWMNANALAAAYDVEGAFNEALVALERGASLPAVLDAVDRLIDPYGGRGAYGVADQFSNRFISEEINGLRASSVVVPPIFLAVAAFLLNIVVSRMVTAERQQIGLIKAFGYSNLEVGAHYFKLVLTIAAGGALAGSGLGVLAGRALAGIYQVYYKFPFLVFQLDPAAFVTGVTVSILAASAGGIFVLRQVFALTPAVAMRPPAPADYSRSGALTNTLKSFLDQPTRMVLRRIMRQPRRVFGAVISIAAGMALSVSMVSLLAGFDRMLEQTFSIIDRSDLLLSFVQPMPERTLFELRQLEGVIEVEPVRIVPAVLRNGRQSYRGGVNGLIDKPRLNRAVDANMRTIEMPGDGIILARQLAEILDISPGETLTLDVLEGRRPRLEVPVAGTADTLLGSPAFMQIDRLNRTLGEPGRISAAYLRIDAAQGDALFRAFRDMPMVAGVTLKKDARAAFKKIMDSGAGATRFIMAAVAAIITFGIVYNSARISFSEQARDLASLRVIGFTRGETAYVLLGELAVIVMVALPLGILIGRYLSYLIARGFSTDLYQIPISTSPASYGYAAVAVLLAALASGWLVKRDIDRVDLVATLKTRE